MNSLVSVRLLLFLASAIIFGASIFLVRKNSHTRKGGDDYVRRKKRKIFGYILLFPAVLLLALAVFNDEMATDSYVVAIDTVAAAAAQAYRPPVLPKPTTTLLPPNDTWKTQVPGPSASSGPSTPSVLHPRQR